MNRFSCAAFVVAALISRTCLADDAISMTCSFDKPEAEIAAIKAAGAPIKRNGKHELMLKAGGKTLFFRDKKPYDDVTEGGISYRFCGYQGGFFLLSKQDSSAYSGVLINAQTGAVTAAGSRVFFSPDRHAFVAIEEPNCADSESWKVYAPSGRLWWTGDNYISKAKSDSFFTIEKPVWTQAGELTATANCSGIADENSWKVTLTKLNGEWSWQPYRECKP